MIWTSKLCPLQRGVCYIGVLHKNWLILLQKATRYSPINPQKCQEAGVGRGRSLKAIY